MFKWFDNWFYKQSKKAWDRDRIPSIVFTDNDCQAPEQPNISGAGVSFTVYSASGGYVVQHYVMSQDKRGIVESNSKLTIVTRDQDLGEVLSHIITLEALKN
jgi:hypothetical protein